MRGEPPTTGGAPCSRARRAIARYGASRAAAIALGVVLIETACTTANPVMTFLFDGVPAPGEKHVAADAAGRKPRREPYKPPPPAVRFVEVPDLPPAIDWKARYQELPRTEGGDVAWTKALDDKVITPKPGLADDAKDEDATDMDVELTSSGQAEYKVVFPHKGHTLWMPCAACHTAIFEMEHGKTKFSMEKINNGEQCGVCHGKVAAPDVSACPVCHTAMGKS